VIKTTLRNKTLVLLSLLIKIIHL